MRALSLTMLGFFAAVAAAQDAAAPAFEVVSVKPSAMQNGAYGIALATFPGGRILGNMVPLDYFISQAFDIQMFQIAGGPRWIHEDRWDIEAKPPAGSKASQAHPRMWKLPPTADVRLMMQALLADRFHMKWHRESKEGPVYLLTRTNRELKLKESADKEEYPWVGSVAGGAIAWDGLRGTNVTMAEMASRLSNVLNRPVLDRTGLEGAFDFQYVLDKNGDTDTDRISALMASVAGLGLKLEAGRGPVETLVIDAVEKPSGN